MYDNIGRKIMDVAEVFFVLGAILSFVMGVQVIQGDIPLILQTILDEDTTVFTGILVILIGTIISLVFSWFIYGFGKIIDLLSDIEYNTQNSNTQTKVETEKNEKNISSVTKRIIKAALQKSEKAVSKKVNNIVVKSDEKETQEIEFIDVICPECNELLSFEKDFNSGECPACGAAIKLIKTK